MALKIMSTCINCDVCLPACPNEAIFEGEVIYEIRPERCTECQGHYDVPQCQEVCPVACIVTDPAHVETPEALLDKARRLGPLSEDSASA